MLITVISQNIQYGLAVEGRLDGLYDAVREIEPDLLLLQEANDLTDQAIQRISSQLSPAV
jgi:endonuclease/exonuclease/phosphatase family metal-dependent hydrolase